MLPVIVWKDCPSCGAVDAMKRSDTMTFKAKSTSLKKLGGYECTRCHDGIFDLESDILIQEAIDHSRLIKEAHKEK